MIKTIYINEQFKDICQAAGLNSVSEFISYAICVEHEKKLAPIYYGTKVECFDMLEETRKTHESAETFEIIEYVNLTLMQNHCWIFAALRKTTIQIDFLTSNIKDGQDVYIFTDYRDMIFTLISLLKKQLNKKEKTNE